MSKGYQEIKTTLSPDEANLMIEKVARFIVEKQMGSAGILLLESLHPLHGIASQAMYFILPFAEMVFDSQKYQQFALMIQDEGHFKRLIKRIDELDEELNRERREEARISRQRRKNKRKAFLNKIFKRDNKSAE
ncbi:MAG: hypothetical protein KBA54_04780 [Candidatus Cloacimonetes bacterium]|nr:hypothetical protein [Candidatus Cloacimonadota bacterium]